MNKQDNILNKTTAIELSAIFFINILNGLIYTTECVSNIDSILTAISDTAKVGVYITLPQYPILALLITIIHAAILEPPVVILTISVIIINIYIIKKNNSKNNKQRKKNKLSIKEIILYKRKYFKVTNFVIRWIIIINIFATIALLYKSTIFDDVLKPLEFSGWYGIVGVLALVVPILALLAMLTTSSFTYDFFLIEIGIQISYIIAVIVMLNTVNIPSILTELIYIKVYIEAVHPNWITKIKEHIKKNKENATVSNSMTK